ncbi:MAG: methionine adenosyltransferase domain-containing protein [Betaproteobacteria bacterium]|nr:methionine adenosyltransferase domain-containing protein [Betaproteobacteria bacterium]
MARFPARQVVARGWARKFLVQIVYAIGVAGPVSFPVETFGTGQRSAGDIGSALRDEFELTPAGVLKALDRQRPIYELTTTDGHFGRVREGFTSEPGDRELRRCGSSSKPACCQSAGGAARTVLCAGWLARGSGLAGPGNLDLPVLRNAVAKIETDEALVRDAYIDRHALEVGNDVFGGLHGNGCLELRCVGGSCATSSWRDRIRLSWNPHFP